MIDISTPNARPHVELRDETIEELAQVFKLLSEPNRLRIVSCITCCGERSVTEICEHVGISQPLVSHHIALLRVAGILERRREGKHNYYSICDKRLTALMDALALGRDNRPPCGRFLECMLG